MAPSSPSVIARLTRRLRRQIAPFAGPAGGRTGAPRPPPPAPQRLALHIGAHKTASTHFHWTFSRNPEALRPLGWACPPKKPIRAHVTRAGTAEGKDRPGRDARDAALTEMAEGLPNLLLPDENIVGDVRSLFRKGTFYPNASRRLRKILRYLRGYDVEVMLTIRDPASFVPSAYGEALRFHGYVAPEVFLDGDGAERLVWSDLVARLLEVMPRRMSLTLWRFEGYFDNLERVQRHVLGLPPEAPLPDLSIAEEVVRPGLSERALEEIRPLGPRPPRKAVEALMARYPKSAEYPPPRLFDARTRARLSAAYVTDLERLRAMDRVRMLTP